MSSMLGSFSSSFCIRSVFRITSLSSQRDKRRFCVRISPTDPELKRCEPGLTVLSTPLKVVSKLVQQPSQSRGAGSSSGGCEGAEAEEPAAEEADGGVSALARAKRERDDDATGAALREQEAQLHALQQGYVHVLDEMKEVRRLVERALALMAPAAGAGTDSGSAGATSE